jgi:hypothetical protein
MIFSDPPHGRDPVILPTIMICTIMSSFTLGLTSDFKSYVPKLVGIFFI